MKEQEAQAKLSLKLQAYQYLKTKILNCEYRPNEFLNEQKLCAEMGNISRTPMRDALGRLEQEGLITILPKKGLMVSASPKKGRYSMFGMRLLSMSLRPACPQCHPPGAAGGLRRADAPQRAHRGLLQVGRRLPRTADEHPAQQVSALCLRPHHQRKTPVSAS